MFEVWFAPEGKGLVTIYMGTGPSILMIGLALHHLSPTSLLLASYLHFAFFLSLFLFCLLHNFPFSIRLLTILFVNVGDVSP